MYRHYTINYYRRKGSFNCYNVARIDIWGEIGVDAVPCVQGKILGSKQSIRIYSIKFIKGLEFGAIFFHNLDDLSLHDDTLTNKYIYVGLSRANLFLGVTMNADFSEDLQFLSAHFAQGNWNDLARNNLVENTDGVEV